MKFEMNMYTVGLVAKEGLIVNKGLVQRQMTLLNHRVVINTNKPDGIVQLGRDTVDLTYTDNIRGSLESLVHAAKRREGGLLTGGMLGRGLRPKEKFVADVEGSRADLEAMSLYHCQPIKDWKTQNIGGMYTPTEEDIDELIRTVVEQRVETVPQKPPVSFPMVNAMYGKHCSSEHASGRTFRALLDVMKTASESPEGSLTLFVVQSETSKNVECRKLVNMLSYSVQGVDGCFSRKSVMLPGDRRIMIITKNQSSKITEPCQVVYDHTVQGN